MNAIQRYFCCLFLLVFGFTAVADVVYYEGFENVSACTWPCDPNDGLNLNSLELEWLAFRDANNGVAVIDNPLPGTLEGSQYLRMERLKPDWTTAPGRGGISASIVLDEPLDGIVTFSFAFMHDQGELSVTLYDSTAPTGSQNAVRLLFGPTGTVGYLYFGVTELLDLEYSRNEWHQVKIVANFNTNTYDLWLNGVAVSSRPFDSPQARLDHIHFGNVGTSIPALVYLDRIKIEVGTAECAVQQKADITGDCEVNLQDFAVFAASWLSNNIDP